MARLFRRARRFRRQTQPGAPPGTLIAEPGAAKPVIQVMAYGPEGHAERAVDSAGAAVESLDRFPVTWINVDGLGDTSVIADFGQRLGFHKLALEDVIHPHQRAKVEPYENYFFIVARMPLQGAGMEFEQVSIFLGKNYVVTFQEHPGGDVLDPVRQRIRNTPGPMHHAGADYLMYAILDTIVDHYFPIAEHCGDRIDDLESEVVGRVDPQIPLRIHELKRGLISMRRAVWPLREAVHSLIRDPSPLVSADTRIFLRDCSDHTIQIIDLVETYRDMASGLHDLYLSTVSNRTNDIMRILTVIATVFIPLTFIVGVYGMNFDGKSPWNMPELRWYWGYPAVLLVMAGIAAAMLLYFRRKGWLGAAPPTTSPGPTAPPEH